MAVSVKALPAGVTGSLLGRGAVAVFPEPVCHVSVPVGTMITWLRLGFVFVLLN